MSNSPVSLVPRKKKAPLTAPLLDHDPTLRSKPYTPAPASIPDSPTLPLTPRVDKDAMQPEATEGIGARAPVKKPSALRGFLAGFLNAAGQSATRALESGNVGWGGVAQAIGGGIGGGAAGAYDPTILLKQREDADLLKSQAQEERSLKLEGERADVAHTKATTVELQGRPAIERIKEARLAAKDKSDSDLKAEAAKNLKEYHDGILDNYKYHQKNDPIQAELNRRSRERQSALLGHDKMTEATAKQERENDEAEYAANEAKAQAEEAQAEIKSLVAQDAQGENYEPVIDRGTGEVQTRDKPGEPDDKSIIYSHNPNTAYRERHARITVLEKAVKDYYDIERTQRAKVHRTSSNTDTKGNGRYSGQQFSRAELPAMAEALGKTQVETEQYIIFEGGRLY